MSQLIGFDGPINDETPSVVGQLAEESEYSFMSPSLLPKQRLDDIFIIPQDEGEIFLDVAIYLLESPEENSQRILLQDDVRFFCEGAGEDTKSTNFSGIDLSSYAGQRIGIAVTNYRVTDNPSPTGLGQLVSTGV